MPETPGGTGPGLSRKRAEAPSLGTPARHTLLLHLDADLAALYGREGEAIKSRQAVLEGEGFSSKDAGTIARDEVLRACNPELADYLDAPYPPEIRHDALLKRDFLLNHIEDRKERSFAKRLDMLGG